MRKLLIVPFLLAASPAFAQTVVLSPTKVAFAPSPDHALTTLVAGSSTPVPLVTNYALEVRRPSGQLAFPAKDLGKPGSVSGVITVTVPEFSTLSPGVIHTLRVLAVNASGSTPSADSLPFGIPVAVLPLPALPGTPTVTP